jgi:hypothetical protein
MRTIIGLASSILSIGGAASFLVMPCSAQSMYTQTVTPTIVYPVEQTEEYNYNPQPSSDQASYPCLRSSNSKLYIDYGRDSSDVPNTPSDYSEATAKYRYCG